MTFSLHPNLEKKAFLIDLPLCRVLLEDERHYPWLFLVPRIEKASKIIDLSLADQIQLTQELDLVQKIVWKEFQPDQINVAAIGNKTPQLHIHVIARYKSDPAWPQTIWDHPIREPYEKEAKSRLVQKLRNLLEPASCIT